MARANPTSKSSEPVELDFDALIPSFEIELKSLGRSPLTYKAYLLGINGYRKWLADNGHPGVIDRRLVQEWIAYMVDNGAAAATAASRLAGVRQLSKWLANENEIPANPLLGVNAPKGTVPLTPVLGEDKLKALVKACSGTELKDRRDEALIRLLAETGLRAAEVVALEMDDVKLSEGLVIVRRGKGDKARVAAFGAATARSLDRYARLRRHHPAADFKQFFLAAHTRTALSTAGLRHALGKRAKAAGIQGFHPHVLRHSFAGRWMAAQGSETALMTVAGWSDPNMLRRYARATAATRAADEARTLDLGNY